MRTIYIRTSLSRKCVFFLLLFLFIATHDAVCQIHPVLIDSSIKLDGRLDESVWSQAEPITDFTQKELNEGASSTEKTEVRVLYDDDNIYFGFTCYDSEPDKIISKILKRDGDIYNDDRINIIIDTYNDKRMGYFFAVNPNGMRMDASLQSVGDVLNSAWDGIWETEARITEFGWTCEVVIPFKTLRFPTAETQVWGINFKREIKRKNEEVLWRNWKRNEGIFQLSGVGTLTITRELKKSRNIDAKPYVLAGLEKENGKKTDDTFKYGLDMKYGITSNTTLTLTTKTDFAQIDSDREIINLSRSNISYPEKRDFFLEGAETFDFTQGGMRHFYSRRIGISPDRQLMPILGGAKLTQKSGGYRLGVLTMQTEEEYGLPSTNYSVARVKKDVLEQSYIGFLVTNLYEMDARSNSTDHHDNQVYAMDFGYKTNNFFGDKNLEVQGYLAGSVTDNETKDNLAGRVIINYPNDLFNGFLLYHARDHEYNPEIGFADRLGVKQYMVVTEYTPRPSMPFIKKLSFQPFFLNYYTDMNDKPETGTINFRPFGFITDSNDQFQFDIQHRYENHEYESSYFNNRIVIPVGDYDWWEYGMSARTSRSRTFALDFGTNFGNAYNGKFKNYSAEFVLKSSKYYSLSADMDYNEVSIFGQNVDTRNYGGRLEVDFSTKLFSSTFIQWNNETNKMNVNFRIHYIPKAGSDLYIVYNHLMDENDDFRTLQQAGMLKANYTYRF